MQADGATTVLTVYSRSYCHLCEEMIAELRALQARYRFDLRIVDVDADAALEARHGERVPVLMHGDRELCHYRLDVPALTDYLLSGRSRNPRRSADSASAGKSECADKGTIPLVYPALRNKE